MASDHKWVFLTSCAVQHLGLSGKYWGLHYVLEDSTPDILWLEFSGGGSKDVGKLVDYFCARYIDCYVRYLLRGIRSCCQVVHFIRPLFSGVVVLGSTSLGYLFNRDSKIIRGNALRLLAISREVFSPPSCFVIMRQIRFRRGLLSSLLGSFLCSIFSLILLRRRELNRGN